MENHRMDKQIVKRPKWLTLCMTATAASVILLAGCGDNEEPAPPAEQSAPLEQNSTNGQASSPDQEPMMEQDPGLGEATNPGEANNSNDTMMQNDAESDADMSETQRSSERMPENTMDEPAMGTMNPSEDEAGFGEGTDPMPGASDDTDPDASESNLDEQDETSN